MEKRKPQLANKQECTGCMACTDSCLHDALHYYLGNDGHYYIEYDEKRCVGCLICEKTCPISNGQKYGGDDFSTFYAAWNKDDKEREKSASGGAFSAMARYTIEHGGAVIGVATEMICDAKHEVVYNKVELQRLQGSKYTQSNTCGIYRETLRLLKEGKLVLFSGTGCQVGGLLSFLKNKKYEGKIITVDLICGGVPSKLLLQKFVENEPYKIKKILSYRTKEKGWKPKGFVYNLKVEDEDGKVHDYTGKRNLVTTGFSTEMTERYSCYNCRFVGKNRLSDFTIGDLWGDTEFPQEHYKGLSLVIAHNHRAEAILQEMEEYIHTELCNETSAAKVNFRLVNGRNIRKYTLERKYLEQLFSKCSYQTLKKIYANDYKLYSPWTGWKVIRYLFLKILSTIVF